MKRIRQKDPDHLRAVRALPCIACEIAGVQQTSPTEGEVWAPAFGWEDAYEVSTLGRIRSIARKGKTQFGTRDYGGKIVSPIMNKRGYLVVNLTRGSFRKQIQLHRLVLLSFVGACPDGMEACHNNGIKHDARLGNLRWDTRSGNHADKWLHGTQQIGERNPNAKLTELQAIEVKKSSDSIKDASEKLGVSRHCVDAIRRGETWRHL